MRDKMELYTMLNSQEVTIQTPLHEAKVGSYFRLIENFVRRRRRHHRGHPHAGAGAGGREKSSMRWEGRRRRGGK